MKFESEYCKGDTFDTFKKLISSNLFIEKHDTLCVNNDHEWYI